MRRRIDAVKIAGLPQSVPPDRPLMFVANHVSWWDGFVLREVQRAIRPGAPLHTTMLESELKRFPFLRLLGAVGIEPGVQGSVDQALDLLRARVEERPDSVLLFFPQGQIWPSHRRPLGFRRGVDRFATRLRPLLLPTGIHAEPLNAVAPTFFVSLGEPHEWDTPSHKLEQLVEAQLDAILTFTARHGEDSPGAWPPRSIRLEELAANRAEC
ncbi:MAG TPA: lysophospholipid acyltransferase family protein [Longimicrobiaceae bacterium]|nr:lysophospholipid acyltransferase family protein [Longimicrobiaceae bacterium]